MNNPAEKSTEEDSSEVFHAPLTVYADQLIQLGVGPLVSKLTFVSGQPGQKALNPVLTLVLPTAGLISMLKNATATIRGPELIQQQKILLKEYQASFEEFAKFIEP